MHRDEGETRDDGRVEDTEVVVEQVLLDDAVLAAAIGVTAGIAVLPLRVVGGTGVYSESSIPVVKELRAFGAAADYAHPSTSRRFEAKKSAEILVTLVLGILSSASWDLLKRWMRAKTTTRLSVTYVELQEGNLRRGRAWKIEGDTDGVIQAIDRLRDDPSKSRELGDGPNDDE
jgi:hypothetical protein